MTTPIAPNFVTSWFPILQVSSSIVVTPTITPGSGHQFANAAISVVPSVSTSANAIYSAAVAETVTPSVSGTVGITFPGETTSVSVAPAVSAAAQVLNGVTSAVTVTPSISVAGSTLMGATPAISVTPAVSASATVAGGVTQAAITVIPSISATADTATSPAITAAPSVTVGAGVVLSVTSAITATPSVSPTAGKLFSVTSAPAATPSVAAAASSASISFDTIGSGVVGGNTWSHNAQTGAYVLAVIACVTPPSTVKYGTTSMTRLGNATDVNGYNLYFYGISNVAAGPTTITITSANSIDDTANSISFTGAMTAATPVDNNFTGTTTGSQSPTCTTGQMIVQSFMDFSGQINSASGGTLQWSYADSDEALTISTSPSSTTFNAGLFTTDSWTSLYVVLSP